MSRLKTITVSRRGLARALALFVELEADERNVTTKLALDCVLDGMGPDAWKNVPPMGKRKKSAFNRLLAYAVKRAAALAAVEVQTVHEMHDWPLPRNGR